MNLLVDVPRGPAAEARLTRVQMAQKLRSRRCDYPRAAGVLVPCALAEVCGGDVPPTRDPRDMGRGLVLRLARMLHGLPEQLLALELPHPSAALRWLPIEDRTRSVLERLLPLLAREPSWTVEGYLRIPKFGPRCLLDLLAACEEADANGARSPLSPEAGTRALGLAARVLRGAGAPETPVRWARLDELSRLLRQCLPMVEGEVARLLVDEGFSAAPVGFFHLAGVYRALAEPAPFRIMTSDCEPSVAVAADSHGFAAAVATKAARLIAQAGVATVQAVVNRVGSLAAAQASRVLVSRLLVSLPRLRWLDDRMEWFSLVGDRSRLRGAVEQAFAVAERVSMRDLLGTLRRVGQRAPRAPRPVLERYLSEIADCEIDPRGVRRRGRGAI